MLYVKPLTTFNNICPDSILAASLKPKKKRFWLNKKRILLIQVKKVTLADSPKEQKEKRI